MEYDYEESLRRMDEYAASLKRGGHHESARIARAAADDCRRCYETIIKPLSSGGE